MTIDSKSAMSTEEEAKHKDEQRTLDAVYWGGVLIWAGLVFWADSAGWLLQTEGSQAWSWVFLGAGVYGFVISFVRLASSKLSKPAAQDYIWAGIFLLIGLGGLTSFTISWPLILIVIGVVTLGNVLFRRK
jgi:MFS family permease